MAVKFRELRDQLGLSVSGEVPCVTDLAFEILDVIRNRILEVLDLNGLLLRVVADVDDHRVLLLDVVLHVLNVFLQTLAVVVQLGNALPKLISNAAGTVSVTHLESALLNCFTAQSILLIAFLEHPSGSERSPSNRRTASTWGAAIPPPSPWRAVVLR